MTYDKKTSLCNERLVHLKDENMFFDTEQMSVT